MLSPHAYSFRQKSRLAISLSWIAGYTNVVTLIVFSFLISHATGNTTWFGRMLVRPGDAGGPGAPGLGVWHFAYALLTFFAGAILSAFMTEKADRRGVSSRYIAPIAAEAILLSVYSTAIVVWSHVHPGVAPPFLILGIASLAMGLQNATITKISGSVVRTTHVTGVVTDLGLEGVQLLMWWRDKTRAARPDRYGRVLRVTRRHPSALRVLLLASIYGSFLFGVCAGALVQRRFPAGAMLAPILFLLWIVVVDYRKPIGAVTEMDPMSDPELAVFGIVKSLLPPELGVYRLSHHKKDEVHQAPNFQTWLDRLPHGWRVVILALSPFTHFDAESVADLKNAIARLRGARRRLVIAGLTQVQFKRLQSFGILDAIDVEDMCPDLEFAIARGIELVRELRGQEEDGPIGTASAVN